ncbi:hypothetical protein ABZ815_41010 [Nonomuraea sp. NPDC047529]|uniref:hypothetical protein n=1 Tax=Nonomuraea sp. NPDC047529 TaxID=3155623 RepID=UPI0033DBE642
MGHRTRSLSRADVTTALAMTLDAAGAAVPYRLCGTSAALLQGVPLPAGDIDLLMPGRAELDTFAAALSAFPRLHAAAWMPESAQYFARFAVNGVEVELSTVERPAGSDVLECVGEGPWRHHVLVACGSHQVPAVRLEIRLATELLRDRADRYGPIIDHLGVHGFDPDLLRRAMDACDVPAARRQPVQNLLVPGA